MIKQTVVFSFLGSTLDAAPESERWKRWRPNVCLCAHQDFSIARLELLSNDKFGSIEKALQNDIKEISPKTLINVHKMNIDNPWELEETYSALFDFLKLYQFKPEQEEYYAHITTGTHIAQICLFLLTESHHIPGKLIQTSPSASKDDYRGTIRIIDLDLASYDKIKDRFKKERRADQSILKNYISTKNKNYNSIVDRLELITIKSKDPILLMGPTGSGKTQLASKVYELKKSRQLVSGEFVALNCATLKGDAAMSALFGHTKGSFTGAISDRKGLISKSDRGILFLDEIGELGSDEQAMLLRALEFKTFLPLGSDKELTSDFQLIAGTNKDLDQQVIANTFRDDLLARINTWTFRLPALTERKEDIEPNIDYELERFAEKTGYVARFTNSARQMYLEFALSSSALWLGNFRDLASSITRLGTLAPQGVITDEIVRQEINVLLKLWQKGVQMPASATAFSQIRNILDQSAINKIDLFDLYQLEFVINVCKESISLSEAGRKLFSVSRSTRSIENDSDRLRKYLLRYGIDWKSIKY